MWVNGDPAGSSAAVVEAARQPAPSRNAALAYTGYATRVEGAKLPLPGIKDVFPGRRWADLTAVRRKSGHLARDAARWSVRTGRSRSVEFDSIEESWCQWLSAIRAVTLQFSDCLRPVMGVTHQPRRLIVPLHSEAARIREWQHVGEREGFLIKHERTRSTTPPRRVAALTACSE